MKALGISSRPWLLSLFIFIDPSYANEALKTAAGLANHGLTAAKQDINLCADEITNQAKKSATVCFMTSLSGECTDKQFSCEFTSKELANVSPLWVPGFGLRLSSREQAGNESVGVWQQQFDYITGTQKQITTSGLYPCLGISLMNSTCGFASLAHVDVQDPGSIFKEMGRELNKQPGCKSKDTSIFMLLSNLVDEDRAGAKRDADNLYYRKIICSAAQLFPERKIQVLLKSKRKGESNSMTVERSEQGYTVEVTDNLAQEKKKFNVLP